MNVTLPVWLVGAMFLVQTCSIVCALIGIERMLSRQTRETSVLRLQLANLIGLLLGEDAKRRATTKKDGGDWSDDFKSTQVPGNAYTKMNLGPPPKF